MARGGPSFSETRNYCPRPASFSKRGTPQGPGKKKAFWDRRLYRDALTPPWRNSGTWADVLLWSLIDPRRHLGVVRRSRIRRAQTCRWFDDSPFRILYVISCKCLKLLNVKSMPSLIGWHIAWSFNGLKLTQVYSKDFSVNCRWVIEDAECRVIPLVCVVLNFNLSLVDIKDNQVT